MLEAALIGRRSQDNLLLHSRFFYPPRRIAGRAGCMRNDELGLVRNRHVGKGLAGGRIAGNNSIKLRPSSRVTIVLERAVTAGDQDLIIDCDHRVRVVVPADLDLRRVDDRGLLRRDHLQAQQCQMSIRAVTTGPGLHSPLKIHPSRIRFRRGRRISEYPAVGPHADIEPALRWASKWSAKPQVGNVRGRGPTGGYRGWRRPAGHQQAPRQHQRSR